MTIGERGQAGFSLVELLVAMVITLIISGAIFGLLSGGQNAFRREPEMVDRQQAIRVAMNLIKRDVAGAGAGMVPFVQAFTNGLDGQGGAPSSTQTAGSSGQATDILEVLTSSGQCRTATLASAAASGSPLNSAENLPACFPDSGGSALFLYVGVPVPTAADRGAYAVVLGKGNVAAGTQPFQISPINAATVNLNPTGASPSAGFCTGAACTVITPVDVARYQIAADPSEPTVPCLWRSSTGKYDSAGSLVSTPPGGNWQLIARGIEDLQVEYMNGSGAWATTPGDVYCASPCTTPATADLNRVVHQVRITLSARATGRQLQGQTTAAGGSGSAIRGQLVAVLAPRAALQTLTLGTPGAAGTWY